MKVVSYNIHRGLSRRGLPILADVADELAARDADVIALQEVSGIPAGHHPDQSSWLADRLSMHARFAVNAETRHGPLGNATLSRSSILDHDNLDLSLSGFEPRGALRTTLASGVDVWNVHLGLTHRQRSMQWQRLASRVESCDGSLVVCGDFNDWAGGLGRRIARAGLHGALLSQPRRRRATFPAHRPWLALDRLYHRGLRLVAADVLRGQPWSQLSDHLPVEATFAEIANDPEQP